jgi:predicted nucleic acid-binding Zn ribbon protein
MNLRQCINCGGGFVPATKLHAYCSERCRYLFRRQYGTLQNKDAYAGVDGNWARYFGRLCNKPIRKGQITSSDCLALLEKQEYKCALTGIPLTCRLKLGEKTKTNASLDRINPKGSYHPSNVQLVCVAVNSFRVDISIKDFQYWCRKVAEYALRK